MHIGEGTSQQVWGSDFYVRYTSDIQEIYALSFARALLPTGYANFMGVRRASIFPGSVAPYLLLFTILALPMISLISQNVRDCNSGCVSMFLACRDAPSCMGNGVFTPSWVPANPAGRSQRGTCFCVVHTAIND